VRALEAGVRLLLPPSAVRARLWLCVGQLPNAVTVERTGLLDGTCRCFMGLRLADVKLFGLIVPSRGVGTSQIPGLGGMTPRARSPRLGSKRKLL